VFSGVLGGPEQRFPQPTYTALATSALTCEAPFLYTDSSVRYNVFVPAVQHNSSGTSWSSGPAPGTSIPIGKFLIALPGDSVDNINKALGSGKNLILTPGVYHLGDSIRVTRPDS